MSVNQTSAMFEHQGVVSATAFSFDTEPALGGTSGVLFAPSVVHASTKLEPAWLFTVTFSFVGVVL